MNFTEIVNRYPKEFKKAGVNANILGDLDRNYEITESVTELNGRKVVFSTTNTINAEYYANSISAIGWFKDRVTRSYTMAGYIATRLSALSPDKKTRIVREYRFNYKG